MPAGEEQERERFAAVVERGLNAVPSAAGDDELLRELELVALLRQSRAALAPSADESARMRAKVMAAAATMMQPAAQRDELRDTMPNAIPRVDAPTLARIPAAVDAETLVHNAPVGQYRAEAADEPTNVVPFGRVRRGRHRFPSQPASRRSRGLLGISAAAAVMAVAVAGGGAMFSQGALPGDTLYGIKQTTESAMVGLTPGQGNKAERQLDYASTRLDEAQKVNAANTPDNEKAADVSQALKGFEDQTQSGAKMQMTAANSGSSAENTKQLTQMSNWAQQQNQRLSAMRSSMPASAQPDADHSAKMLEDLRTRAQSLKNRQGCDKVSSGSDELGPIPAKGPCKASAPASSPAIGSAVPSATQTKASTPSPDSTSSSSHSDSTSSSNSTRSDKSDRSDRSSSKSDDRHDSNGPLGSLSGDANDDNPTRSDTLTPPQRASNGGLLGNLFGGANNDESGN